MSKELIERLREAARYGVSGTVIAEEAADLIKQQQKRIEELERTNGSYKNLTEAQEKQLSALRQRLYELRGADKTLASERDANEELTEQLAASQAREAKLRVALEKLVRFNSSNEYTEVLSTYISNGRAALFLATDDTALHEMIQKAGEVMRGKTINEIETYRIPVGNSPAGELACEWTYDALKEIRDEIRNLPVVTLEDF